MSHEVVAPVLSMRRPPVDLLIDAGRRLGLVRGHVLRYHRAA